MSPSILLLGTLLVPALLTSAGLFPSNNGTAHIAALHACNELQSSLGTQIVQSTGPQYDTAATNAWNLENSQFQPTCIVFPRVSAHVQTAMKAIYNAGSQYAVQAGSHSAMKGWNTVQDGVLIIFSNMKNVSYSTVSDTITLEPGIHWGEATTALAPFGVAPVGGRVSDVGTGLLLGGGLSWLGPSQGYAADTFKELDVVLVTGQLVTATATNRYSDLFRALKGGGNRFGIVTRYEVHAAHTGTANDKPYFGGQIVYNSSAEALLNATAKYIREVNDPNAVLLLALTNIAIEPGVLFPFYIVDMFYHGSELPTDIFGDFLSIPAVTSQLGPMSYPEVLATLGPESDRGFVQHYGASALVGDEGLFLDAFNHWSNFTSAGFEDLNLTTLGITPITKSQIQAGRAKGGNIISPPDGPFAAIQLGESFKAGVRSISPVVQQGIDLLFEQIPPSPGLPLYLNECDSKQKVFESYGEYELLKHIYAKYDPTRFNVEHTQGPIGL
ncbi:FAD-binding domain-containing protein [Mycena polygramma]|nr:FAD-binding domain-containing protein [Mycena polygramma]